MQKENKGSIDLTRGSIPGGILAFAIPLFLGQLLQQLYNMVDAWVIGNFADNDAFAAVSSTGTVVFLIIGDCFRSRHCCRSYPGSPSSGMAWHPRLGYAPCLKVSADLFRRCIHCYPLQHLHVHHACPG